MICKHGNKIIHQKRKVIEKERNFWNNILECKSWLFEHEWKGRPQMKAQNIYVYQQDRKQSS